MSGSVSVPATSRSSDAVIAYTILRVSFGANIMLHGVSRFYMGHAAFLAYLTHYFEKTTLIPASSLPLFALIGGALVLTGLVIGTNLAQDWLVSGLQLIYAFLYYYLLAHRGENRI